MGVASISIARRRGRELACTFAVLDWLLLGITLALAGGADSWLLVGVPALVVGQLSASPRSEWPYLLAPSLLLVIVLAIADPTLGGGRGAGAMKLAVLIAAGLLAAQQLRRPHQEQQRRPARVDGATGFYTRERLPELLSAGMQEALAQHQPLSVVCLRLQHFEDCRNFLGPQGSEDLVCGVARRISRRLEHDDLAFRVRVDTFLLLLPGDSLAAAREVAASIARDVSSTLIGGRRQTLAAGASSFPTIRRPDELLAAAQAEASDGQGERRAAPQALPVALAR